MARIPGFLLKDRITVSRFTGSGAYGAVYGSDETLKASVQPTARLVVDANGRQQQADAVAFIRPEVAAVPIESRVTWGGVKYRVIAAGAMPDEARPTHRELTIQRVAADA